MRSMKWSGVILLAAFFMCAAQVYAVTDGSQTGPTTPAGSQGEGIARPSQAGNNTTQSQAENNTTQPQVQTDTTASDPEDPAGGPEIPVITVPKVTISKVTETAVEGTVSRALGQTIVLRSADGEAVFDEVKAGTSGEAETFRLTLPEADEGEKTEEQTAARSSNEQIAAQSSEEQTEIELEVKSMPAPGAAASRSVPVKESPDTADRQSEVGEGDDTGGQGEAGEGGEGDGQSGNGEAGTEATQETEPAPSETAPPETTAPPVQETTAKPKTAAEGRAAAVAWAKEIAEDNRFTYGATPYSRHNGCYFCGTNGGKKKRAKKTKWKNGYQGKTWAMTYCCNPFIHAAYAHGAKHPKMLSACKKMNAIDMSKSSYRNMGCFKCLGKPKFSKLVAGDIFVSSNHVWMYCGGNQLVESTSLGGKARSWSADSIRVTGGAKGRYKKARFVMRFTGY